MEEAITDQIIKSTQLQIDPYLLQMNEYLPAGTGGFNNNLQMGEEQIQST